MLGELIKKTTGESLVYFIGQVTMRLISFIALAIFARIFVPAQYGIISLVALTVLIGSKITGSWLNNSVTRFFPYYKRIGKLNIFYSSLLFCILLAFSGFCLLSILLYLLSNNFFTSEFQSLVWLVAVLIILTMGFNIFLFNFRIKQQAKLYVTFQISRTFLGLIAGLLLVIWLHFSVIAIFWGNIIALFIFDILMFKILFLTNGLIKIKSISFLTIKEFAIFGFPAMVAEIGAWILGGIDRYLVKYFWGITEVGLYSMGYNLGSKTIDILATSLILGAGPSLINVWESDNGNLTEELLSKLTRFFIIATLPATIAVSVLAKPILKLFTAPSYYSSYIVIPFSATAAFISGLCVLSCTGLRLAKRTDKIARNYLLAGGINVLLNIIFIPRFGFIAAAIITAFSYFILLILNIKSSNRYLQFKLMSRSLFKIILASLIMGIVIAFVIQNFQEPLLCCLIAGIIGIVVYFAMIFILNELTDKEKLQIKNLYIVFRRNKKLVLIITAMLSIGMILASTIIDAKADSPKGPNVILISIDALRADHLSCYGYERETSQNIDELGQEGALFLNAFSHSPKTTPSHMSMLTSLYPDVHGIELWKKNKPVKRLTDSVVTLAEVLQDRGYTTAAFTGGSHMHASRGFDQGFDIYKHTSSLEKIISFLNNNHKKKFFLFFHTYQVHDPYLPPSPYNRVYDLDYNSNIIDSRQKIAELCKDKVEWEEKHRLFWESVNKNDPRDIYFLKALYDGAIKYTDEQIIAPLLKPLKDLGIYEDTLIVFTSDHGEEFNEHGNFLHDVLYRETLRVPLLIVYPKIIPKNVKIKQLVRLIDIMPTVLDILGINTGMPMQGKSLLPALRNKNLYLPCYSWRRSGNLVSIRFKNYALILSKNQKGEVREFLYDQTRDPEERQNIIERKAGVARRLKKMLSKIQGNSKRLAVYYKSSKEVIPNSETVRRLKGLGYLQ